jgi:hypothetical protein
MADYYKDVPLEFEKNLEYRLELRARAASDKGFRRAMMTACKEDFLFFFAAWCWLYEPRPKRNPLTGKRLPHQIPFIPWEHQVPNFLEAAEHLGERDIGVLKCRSEGWSWFAILKAVHEWNFLPMTAIGLVSATEKKADNPKDPGSLFWKIDWELTQLPKWMVGEKDRDYVRNLSDHTLYRPGTLSSITAFAATSDAGRSGRFKWWLFDEFAFFPRGPDREVLAASQQTTESRLIISTPNGAEGAYFDVMHEPSNMVKIDVDWRQNPTKNRGLYKFEKGLPVAIDPVSNPLPKEYDPPSQETVNMFSRLRRRGFKLEDKIRSPWYDRECDRPGATPQSIAQELDRDFGGSTVKIFGAEFMAAVEATVRNPFSRGDLDFHPETLEPEFQTIEDGPLLLWCNLELRGKPPAGSYTVTADISSGLGGSYTSNSTAQVFNVQTGEQVAEFASNVIQPESFADYCISLAMFFNGAYLGWEVNGPGSGFGAQVARRGYSNVFYRRLLSRKERKKSKELGWHTSKQSKEIAFGQMLRAGRTGEIIIRSAALVKEFGQYIRIGDKIVHEGNAHTLDDAAKGEAHGDRVIAACIGRMLIIDRPIPKAALDEEAGHRGKDPPPGTMAAREKEYQDSLREDGDGWDDTTQQELAMGSRLRSGVAGRRSSW